MLNTTLRLLVCGSRTWTDHHVISRELTDMIAGRYAVVIHGAAKGADSIAEAIAIGMRCHIERYPADWRRDDKAAGPIRNALMLQRGKPDAGLAFGKLWKPGTDRNAGRMVRTGTGDMVQRMLRVGLQVRWVASPLERAVTLETMPEAWEPRVP